MTRRHETSVRLALGAGRLRIVRQFLLESLLVAAGGCGAGILLGSAMMRLLVWMAPRDIPRVSEATLDWRVFAMAAGLATLTGILFGLVPALHASRTRPNEALKAAGRNPGGKAQTRWRAGLTVVEVALSLVLVIGAGLLLKSFARLMGVDIGFQTNHVITMNIPLTDVRYGNADARFHFFELLEQRVRTLPGVQSAAFANRFPLRGGWGSGVSVDTQPDVTHDADFQAVSPGYFETLGIPLLRGRVFGAGDRADAPAVAVVNQAFVNKYLPGMDAVAHRLRRHDHAPWAVIVGVVNDIRRDGKDAQITPQVYLNAAQTQMYPVRLADFAVRAAGDPRKLTGAIQSAVWALDKDQPVNSIRTLDELIDMSVAQRRFQMLLLLLFAAVAVGLAVIGIYGVLSYSVSQRTPELGLRIALGARPGSILAMVLRQAGVLIGCGVAAGLVGSWMLTTYLNSLLFDVRPGDAMTYIAAVALLAAVSVAASCIPPRRGARVDPIVALRYE